MKLLTLSVSVFLVFQHAFHRASSDDIALLVRANQIFLFTCAQFSLFLSLVLDMTACKFIVRSLNQLSLCTLSLHFSQATRSTNVCGNDTNVLFYYNFMFP